MEKTEKENEIKYLQQQLEQLIEEKHNLRRQQTNGECSDQLNKLIEENDSLKAEMEVLEAKAKRADDLQAELQAIRRARDPNSPIEGKNSLRLKDIQCRIEALTLAFRT